MKPGLPKAFAKLGFAKGWKAFKASKKTSTKKAPTRARAKSKPVAKRKKALVSFRAVPAKKVQVINTKGVRKMSKLSKFKGKFKSVITSRTAMETGITIVEIGAGGVIGSMAFGALPVPVTFQRPGLVKSAAQFVTLGLLALMVKEKHSRTLLAGGAALGLVGTVKELFPKTPTLAGEMDYQMYGDPLNGDPLSGMDDETGTLADAYEGDPLAGAASPFRGATSPFG